MPYGIRTALTELPYVRDHIEMAVIGAQMAWEVLWRRCGYDERKPTPEDVQVILDGFDDAKEQFLARVAEHVVIDGQPHLRIVKDAS